MGRAVPGLNWYQIGTVAIGGCPSKKHNNTEPVVFWTYPYFRKLRTLATIQYLSSNSITAKYIHKICSFQFSINSRSPICNPLNICWLTASNTLIFGTTSQLIKEQWSDYKLHDGRWMTIKIWIFKYVPYCDKIRIQIINCSPSSKFSKIRLCCIPNPAQKQ
jgi:hypothetical protein